jgi:hypothetical protein
MPSPLDILASDEALAAKCNKRLDQVANLLKERGIDPNTDESVPEAWDELCIQQRGSVDSIMHTHVIG